MRRRLEARGREQDAGLTKWRYLGVREVFSARGLDFSGGWYGCRERQAATE
jgi:hypothetical protein